MLIILFPRNLAKDHDVIRDEARELLQQVQAKAVEYDSDRKVCDISFFSLRQGPNDAVHLVYSLRRRIHPPPFAIP